MRSLGGHRAVHHATKGRRWPKRVLITVAILLVLVLLGGVGGWFYVNAVLGSIKRVPVESITPESSGAPHRRASRGLRFPGLRRHCRRSLVFR